MEDGGYADWVRGKVGGDGETAGSLSGATGVMEGRKPITMNQLQSTGLGRRLRWRRSLKPPPRTPVIAATHRPDVRPGLVRLGVMSVNLLPVFRRTKMSHRRNGTTGPALHPGLGMADRRDNENDGFDTNRGCT